MLAAATKIAEEGFARTGAADDALAVVEARRATLERAIRTDIQNAGRVASDFATRALEIAKKMKEEHEIPETAARALQKSAVEFLQAKQDDAALDAVNASIEAGSIALSRQERLSMQLEHVVTVALKSQVLFEREEKGAADEVRAKAKAMLDQIDGKKADAEGLARRYSEAADLVAKTGKGYLDR